eukprot:c22488_g1_i1 orf=166-1323(-)
MDCSMGLDDCRDTDAAVRLKVGAIVIILTACVAGVCMPLLGKLFKVFHPEGNLFFVMKSFAAGVILATAYVHMLPDAFDSLSNPCLAENPWAKFPFAGFISMLATLFVLMIDFWATTYYEKKHHKSGGFFDQHGGTIMSQTGKPLPDAHVDPHMGKLTEISLHDVNMDGRGDHANSSDNLSMVSMHAHASSHAILNADHGVHPGQQHAHGPHSHSLMLTVDEEYSQLRHRVISQVLELGIVAHSVIIGITLGTSESPCTIRPLLAALTFHQFFEGMALGSCIAQAGYKRRASALMAFFFSVTTPVGIAIGIGIASSYNANSPKSLIVQGLFDSMSAGILLYMALVDLIAADFLSKKLRSDLRLQLYTYTALFLGSGAMSIIAYWA